MPKKHYLTEAEWQALQLRLADQSATMSVPRNVARQVVTRVDNRSIKATTGQSFFLQKAVIWFGIIIANVLFVSTLIAIAYYFQWTATLGIPLVGAFWFIIAGFTGDQGSWVHGVVGAAIGLSLAAFMPAEYQVPVVLFTLSLWVHRLTYLLAQIWINKLIRTSFATYDMLVEHVEIHDPKQ